MGDLWSTIVNPLVGAGTGSVTTVGLVMLGKLVPLRTVEREREDRKGEYARAALALQKSHDEAVENLRSAHRDTLAQKDGEIGRFRQDLEYERKRADVERDRADRNGELLGATVRETSELLRSLVPSGPRADHS